MCALRPPRRTSVAGTDTFRRLRFEHLEGRRLLATLFRVNAGGATLVGGPSWLTDTAAAPSQYSNASVGNTGTATVGTTIDISHASLPAGTPMAMFQSERFDNSGPPNMLWDFPVAPGQYEVRLYFAETWSGAFNNGVRVFDVQIEGATVLSDYDVFADVGANKGVMKSFVVTSDANLDVDFLRVLQNPAIKGIEILDVAPVSGPLNASPETVNFGAVQAGQSATQQVTLTNGASVGGASITIDPAMTSIAPSGSPYSFSFTQSAPVVLTPGQSTVVSVTYSPTAGGPHHAALNFSHNGSNSPLSIDLFGSVAAPTPLYRIDVGGAGAAGTPPWEPDTAANPSTYSNADEGGNSAIGITVATIDMTHPSVPAGTPMSIFQTERYDKANQPNLLWDFPVSPGQYQVRLYFAETYGAASVVGGRLFDVQIEGATVLEDFDIFAEAGANKGIVKTFTVASDGNLDIDFLRVTQNPTVKAIEILPTGTPTPGTLSPSSSALNFESTPTGMPTSLPLTLINTNAAGGADLTIDPGSSTITPSGQPFTVNWGQATSITLAPGQSKMVTVTYSPTSGSSHSAILTIPHSGSDSPLQISLSGATSSQMNVSFSKSILSGTSGLDRPTSLQFGPDGRLYVAQQNGLIRAYTVVRTAANDYDVIAVENITHIQQIANHNDDGTLNPNIKTRLVTGILVTGTAQNPVIYANSSDPRIGGGSTAADLNLDTNSSTVSRLTMSGGVWTKVDLVRGLPRSEENHHANGMQLDAATNTLYVAMGGNTNMGATSNNFAFLPEFALSAAILSIDLNAIGDSTYDLPTLDDEMRAGVDDANDPFGGNDGRNQARIVPGGPVQVYAPGFRNPYDLLIHSSGRMYTVDNGANAGWGDVPIGEGPNGTATNGVNEPGVSHGDGLHHITGPGYYGGHPNPTRANLANTFNMTNPQSPVPVANAIEGDFRAPGPENGALVVFPTSSNGIAEYASTAFNSAMKGDLLVAVFDNTIRRVKLNAAGTAVVQSEILFTNVGFRPLDVTAPPAGPFVGTIWVCDVAQGTITVFEPSSGGGGNPEDVDGDGYSDADEIANGTDPNSAGDVPPDYDADFVSNLTDADDDNDAAPDTSDKFALDSQNGSTTPIGTLYSWENEGPNLGGILGMGFTGLMTNGTSNYASLFDPNQVTAGGAAGVFTIDSALSGSAKGAANTQQQAFQLGVNVGGAIGPFVAETSLVGPFNGVAPQAGQEMGFYIGTGDQDNFIQLVISGDNGGAIKLGKEAGGVFTTVASQSLAVTGTGFVDLLLTIDPITTTLQASFSINGGSIATLGGPVAVPATWIHDVMAVGLISTNLGGGGQLPVTWDFLGVRPAAIVEDGEAKIEVFPQGSIDNSSTARVDSFRVHNTSGAGQKISSVSIDLNTSFMPDLLFDPDGTAGDVVGVKFTPNTGASATGQTTHQFTSARDGGFEKLEVFFADFNAGETFTFRVDVDPSSVKGSAQPGPADAASISGLEMSGATVTVHYEGGGSQTGQLFALKEGASFYKVHSEAVLNSASAPTVPALSLVGVGTAPAIVHSPTQTVRISGPVGAAVRLLQTEVALHLAGVPGGGFDIDPFEANKVVFVRDDVATIGITGFVDIPVTLRDSRIEGGISYFAAVIETSDGKTGALSNVIKVALNDLPPGSVGSPLSSAQAAEVMPVAGDFDGNGRVDGADFLYWQRTIGSARGLSISDDGTADGHVNAVDLYLWQDGFGIEAVEPTTTTGPAGFSIDYDLGALAQFSPNLQFSDERDRNSAVEMTTVDQAWMPTVGSSVGDLLAVASLTPDQGGLSDAGLASADADDELANLDLAFATVN